MIMSPNAQLSVTGSRVWRGEDKSNGILMLGQNVPYIETSYSKLVISDELLAMDIAFCPFGAACFYDDAETDSNLKATVYAGLTTGTPVFAGVMKYEQGISTGFPMYEHPDIGYGVRPEWKGTLIKRGFVWYKTVYQADFTTVQPYSAFRRSMCLFAQKSTGLPALAAPDSIGADGVPVLAGAVYLGNVEQFEPENQSVLIAVGWDNGRF